MTYIPRISIIGASECSPEIYKQAEKIGKLIAQSGYTMVCGGLGGVMEAASKGAALFKGTIIGILPTPEISSANAYITYPIVTNLGHMRNYLVVLNGDIAVAIAGGYGTLSEIALAQKIGKKVIAMGQWQNLPGVIPATGPEVIIQTINSILSEGI